LWAAIIIGVIGSILFKSSSSLINKLEIDDPLDVTVVHGVCGIWSILAVGIFEVEKGLLYTGKMDQLLLQLVGAICFAFWSGIMSFTFFYILK
jgi:Amt family ammonium transporter